MARVLGLDLGSYSVKGLLVEQSLRATQTRGYYEVSRPQVGERQETLRAALLELLERLPERPEQVVVALPGPALATHQLILPFADPKRIEATIPFEVESQLPFDLSAAVYDYQPVGVSDGAEKKSDLIVGVTRREELQWLLTMLAELKLDPRVVTHPAIAYQNLFLAQPAVMSAPEDGSSVAVLDIGNERTSLAIGTPGKGLEFARTFTGGGRDLTRALAAEFQTTPPEANAWKEQSGAMASAAQGPDAERAAGAFVRGLQPILREVRPSLKSFGSRSRRLVSVIYLCGGTARMPGLAEQLTRDLGIRVELLPLPNELAQLPDASPAAAQSWALALRAQAAGPRAPRFNLRRGEFGFKGDYDYLRGKVGRLAAYAAVLLVLFIGSSIVRNVILSNREAELDEALCDITTRVLGTCEKNFDRALNMMQGKESPTAALPKITAVNLLAEVVQRVPESANVSLDQIVIDLDRITVRGITDSSKQIDEVTQALKGYRCFREVKEGKVERNKEGKTSFRLDIEVQCPDVAPTQG